MAVLITRVLRWAAVVATRKLWILLFLALVLGPTTPAHAESPAGPGDFNLLDILNKLSGKDVQNAMAQFPVPFAAVTRSTNPSAPGGVVETITAFRAGSPKRVDVDANLSTGRGGRDIELLVEQLLGPPFQLRLTVNRLDPPSGQVAPDLTLVIAFPLDAFNAETLAAPPYLFWGYDTRANEPGQTRFIPKSEVLLFTPNVVGGTVHSIGMTLNSTGTPDSVRFLGGMYQNELALNPPPPGASILDLNSAGLRLTPVPATANLTLDTSQLFAPTPDLSQITINWSASAPTTAVLTFDESVGPSGAPTAQYHDVITIDQLPTSEALSLSIDLDGAPPTLSLSHLGNAVIGQVHIERTQTGSHATQTCAFTDVPLLVNLTLEADSLSAVFGPPDAAVNSPVLGSAVCDFTDTNGLLGSPLQQAQVKLENIPDFSIQWDVSGPNPSVNAGVTNAGDSIGFVGVAMKAEETTPYPAIWDPNPSSHPGPDDRDHVLAFEDDADGFRFAAGLAQLQSITYNLDADAPDESFNVSLAGPNHMQFHLLAVQGVSTVLPDDQDIDISCEIHDVPQSLNLTGTNFTDQWSYTASGPIAEITCSGIIGTKHFQITIQDLPTSLAIDYDAASHFDFTVPPGESLGLYELICYDPNGLDSTGGLFGEELRHAKVRVAQIPSFAANWAYGAAFSVNFNTPGAGFIGSAEVVGAVADAGVLLAPSLLPPASVAAGDHYAQLIDQGDSGPQRKYAARVVGIDNASVSQNNAGVVAFNFAADAAHPLRAFWDTDVTSTLTGPDKDILATLNVLNVPASINFSSNLSTQLSLTASAGLNEINFTADIGLKQADDSIQTTHVEGLATGLPSTVGYTLDPAINGSASITMSNPITRVMVELTSDSRILNGDYKHILVDINDIPADWNALWGVAPNPHASLSTSSPLGPVLVVLSRDVKANTPSKYDPFTAAGGAVQYTGFAREIDRRYLRQGQGDDDVREATLMSRLDSLYNTTTQLNAGEDHVIYRKNADGDLDFLSIQGTGFQCVSAQLGPGSLQCVAATVGAGELNASLNLPVAGVHPFYVGIEDPVDKFLTVRIPDVPDTTSVVASPNKANLDFSASPGDNITVYKGPLPSVSDGQEALKVQVINAPSFIHASWDLGFPGGINLDISNPVEIRVLSQGGGDRTVADFVVGDLAASWGIEFGTTTEKCQLDPPGCGSYLNIVKAFFDFEASPAIDGFVLNHTRIGSPSDLSPASPTPPGANEYVPRLTVLVDGFSEFAASVQIEMCFIGICPLFVVLPNVDIDTDLLGSFNLDFWDLGPADADVVVGDPDYITNDPWDLWPLFHSQDDHLFPFN